jgi:hypothetical protein
MADSQHGPGLRVGTRLFFEHHHLARTTARRRSATSIVVSAQGGLGRYEASIGILDPAAMLRIRVSLATLEKTLISKSPRDVCLMDHRFEPVEEGLVLTSQTGPTAGQVFVSVRDAHIFYFQNLTSLSHYAELSGVGLVGTVGAEWPELGFSLPAGENPLPAHRKIQLSDAFLQIDSTANAGTESARALLFIENLCAVYRELPRPAAPWFDWAAMAARTVRDLTKCRDCLRRIDGVSYLNSYMGSDAKPPESMVQGAVRVPLLEYEEWLGKPVKLLAMLKDNAQPFFNREIGVMARWLSGCEFHKDEPSEEEDHGLVDSWYLLHTMMNIGRLAELGLETEREIFMTSLGR